MRKDVELVVGPEHVRDVRRWYVLLVADAVVQGVAIALVVPWLRELLGGDARGSAPWLLALLVACVASGVLHRAASLAGFTVALATLRAVHVRTGEALSRVPLGWFSAGRTGRVTRMVTRDVQMVTMVPAHLMGPIVTSVVAPLTILVVLAFYEWRLAVVTALCLPFLLLAHRLALKLSTRADEAVDEAGTAAAERVLEFARLQPLLRAGGGLSPQHPLGTGSASLESALRDSDRATRAQLTAMVTGSAVGALPVQAALTVLLAAGVQFALSGRVDVATLVAVLVLAARSTEPLSTLSGLSSVVRTSRAAIARFTELATQPTLPEPDTSAAFTAGAAGVEFRDVSFGYTDDQQVLHEVSFTVPAGTTTAIVGPSGSGKTTLTRLVQRAWDVRSGQVLVGGADVRDLRGPDLTDRISVVFQDVHLFTGSLLENIRFGRPDATDEEVLAVGRQARVDEIAQRLPDGWEAEVGEGGASLSGGERQRVSVARALLKNAPVVLLDEPTSSLDPVNEAAVSAGVDALTKDATVLVVAHRLHTIARADQVLVVDGGRIVERGTHAELLAAGGRYAALHAEREQAQGWRLARS